MVVAKGCRQTQSPLRVSPNYLPLLVLHTAVLYRWPGTSASPGLRSRICHLNKASTHTHHHSEAGKVLVSWENRLEKDTSSLADKRNPEAQKDKKPFPSWASYNTQSMCKKSPGHQNVGEES